MIPSRGQPSCDDAGRYGRTPVEFNRRAPFGKSTSTHYGNKRAYHARTKKSYKSRKQCPEACKSKNVQPFFGENERFFVKKKHLNLKSGVFQDFFPIFKESLFLFTSFGALKNNSRLVLDKTWICQNRFGVKTPYQPKNPNFPEIRTFFRFC